MEAEKWDGHKHIDLVIHRARLNIELDGKQHYENARQIVSDLQRSHYSDYKGFDTIHIPNILIQSEFDRQHVADAISKAAEFRARKLGHRFHFR